MTIPAQRQPQQQQLKSFRQHVQSLIRTLQRDHGFGRDRAVAACQRQLTCAGAAILSTPDDHDDKVSLGVRAIPGDRMSLVIV